MLIKEQKELISIWNDVYPVHNYHLDISQKASLQSICNFIINSAGNHAEFNNVSYDWMVGQNKSWVLSRFRVVMDYYPVYLDEVCLKTWVRKSETIFSYRDFILSVGSEKQVAKATTSWAIIDTQTRKPVKVDLVLGYFPHFDGEQVFENELDKIQQPEAQYETEIFKAHYSDLDVNRHVNSIKYIEWMLDSYPIEMYLEKSIQTIEMNYLQEALFGDELKVVSQKISENHFLHSLIRITDSREICRAYLIWK